MNRCLFHREAQAEFEDAVDYYEQRSPGLGLSLIVEVMGAVEQILADPQAWPSVDGEIRRCPTHRFPFGVL